MEYYTYNNCYFFKSSNVATFVKQLWSLRRHLSKWFSNFCVMQMICNSCFLTTRYVGFPIIIVKCYDCPIVYFLNIFRL